VDRSEDAERTVKVSRAACRWRRRVTIVVSNRRSIRRSTAALVESVLAIGA
jgi:hypothetical protein